MGEREGGIEGVGEREYEVGSYVDREVEGVEKKGRRAREGRGECRSR